MSKNGYIRHGDIGYRMLPPDQARSATVPNMGEVVPLGKDEEGDEKFGLALNGEELGLTPELLARTREHVWRMKAILRYKQVNRRLPDPLRRWGAYCLAAWLVAFPAWGRAAYTIMDLQAVQERMEAQIREAVLKQRLLEAMRAAIRRDPTDDSQH